WTSTSPHRSNPSPPPSPKPRGAPQRPATRDEESDQREGEQRRPPPVDQERGHPGDHGEPHEHGRRSCDEHPIERAAAGPRDTPVLTRHARRHVRRAHGVAGARGGPRIRPPPGLATGPRGAPAASAAATPRGAWPRGGWADDATASSVAPANIAAAPPHTPSQRAAPASRSSLKSSVPHRMPSRLLAFHSGNATASPMSL